MRKLPARNDFNAKLNYKLKYSTARAKERQWKRGRREGGGEGEKKEIGNKVAANRLNSCFCHAPRRVGSSLSVCLCMPAW